MNPIAIIIPTLDADLAHRTGKLALIHANTTARLIVSNGPARGFTKTANDGMRQAESNEDVCILNDDIHWFLLGWLSTLQRALYSDPRYAIAGPSGKSSTAPVRDGMLGGQGIEEVDNLPFWCVLIKRSVIKRLGVLDEAFIHYASDNHYCARVRKAGLKCIWVRDVWISHQHHGSGLKFDWKLHDEEIWERKARRLKRAR